MQPAASGRREREKSASLICVEVNSNDVRATAASVSNDIILEN